MDLYDVWAEQVTQGNYTRILIVAIGDSPKELGIWIKIGRALVLKDAIALRDQYPQIRKD